MGPGSNHMKSIRGFNKKFLLNSGSVRQMKTAGFDPD